MNSFGWKPKPAYMNWSLIFKLSLFGLAMAFATVYFIPSNIEPVCWLVIFIICAYLIARYCVSRYFLHGFLVSIVNSIWITVVHVSLFNAYIANHAKEAAMMSKMSAALSPRAMMAITGPCIGVISGLILGLFAFIASRTVKKKAA